MFWFKFWFHWFDRWIWDTPTLPWGLGTFDRESLIDEFHTHPLGKLLQNNQPYLFQQFYWVVVKSANTVRQHEDDLTVLQKEAEDLEAQAGGLEEEISRMPKVEEPKGYHISRELPEKPTPEAWEILLTIGLSLMLFIGISEFLGLDLQGFTIDQWPMLLLGLLGAICINLGEYFAIFRLVKAVRRYDPKRSHSDDGQYKNTIPFWERVKAGDSAIWTSILIVVLETLFAAPGLISLLPPKISVQPLFQITVFAAAGLAAMVNIIIAWGNALELIQWEQESNELKQNYEQKKEALLTDEAKFKKWEVYCERREERERETQTLGKELGDVKARLNAKNRQITAKQQKINELTEKARFEFERWELAVRRWMRENSEVVKKFLSEQAPTWESQLSQNGHSQNGYHRPQDMKNANFLAKDERQGNTKL